MLRFSGKYLLILLLGFSDIGITQNYADPEYYLIDSLDLSSANQIDSILVEKQLEKYHEARTDTGRALAISHIVDMSWDNNIWVPYNNWLYKYYSSLLEFETNPELRNLYLKGKAGALGNKAYFLTVLGKSDEALAIYEESLLTFKELGDYKGVGEILNNMAAIYDSQGDLMTALDFYQKSLKMRIQAKDYKGHANTLNNIGYIYMLQKDHEVALKYFNESLEIRQKIDDQPGIANSYNNIALVNSNIGDTVEALNYYLKSLKIREEYRLDKGAGTTLNNIGMLYYKQHKYDKALHYFEQAREKQIKADYKSGLALALTNLGQLYYDIGNYSKSLQFALQAHELSLSLAYPEKLIRSSELLYLNYKRNGNYQLALEMMELHVLMKDSLVNEENITATQKLQAELEYEKKQAELEKEQAIKDAQYENQIALQEEQKQKQKILTFIGFGGLVLVVSFLAFVFNRLKVTRRQKEEIDAQKVELQQTHEQLEVHHKEISDSILYAKRIQEAIMPSMASMKQELENGFVLYLPKDVVAGDFYWMESMDDKVYFAAADCTGHGVPGAMVSVVCSNALNKAILEEGIRESGKLLDRAREIVIERLAKSGDEVKDGMDISLCALNKSSLQLQWSGANNPLWILRNGEIEEYKADKQPIGKYANSKPFTTHNIQLKKGDRIYVSTDGLQDQFGGPKGKKLKAKAIRELLVEQADKSMNDQQKAIEKVFYEWKGKLEQVDDICMIGIQV